MKAVWELRDETEEQVGVITIEGDWRDATFRKKFFILVDRMGTDNSNQTIIEKEETE